MARKLASVQEVTSIEPIEGADRLVCAQILGWKVVVNKDDFKPGDKCVYFEVDSFLPDDDPRFEFLRARSFRDNEFMGRGMRIRTMKLRGQLSQGLVLPLSQFPEVGADAEVGTDVTGLLRVRKWELPEQDTGAGVSLGSFHAGIPKTDETRVQSEPGLIGELASAGEYYISTKMDGSSCTMYFERGVFGVCGHNFEYKDTPTCAMWNYAHEHGLPEKFAAFCNETGREIAIQGEFCGPGIQKNPLALMRNELFCFTLIDLSTRERMPLDELVATCDALGLQTVPIEERGETFPYRTEDELIERAKGTYKSGRRKEGIVIRPVVPVYSKTLAGPLSMKVINNDYLLKQKD